VTVIDRDGTALAGLAAEGFQTIEGDAREVSVIDAAQPETAEVVVIDVQDPEMTYRDPRLDALDVEMHTVGAATAVALEGAVLHPGLFSVLGSGGESGLEEVTVRNVAVAEVPLRELPLHGGVRVVLVLRDGEVIVPEGDTTLMLHDRVTLGGEPTAVREAFYFLRGHRVEPRD